MSCGPSPASSRRGTPRWAVGRRVRSCAALRDMPSRSSRQMTSSSMSMPRRLSAGMTMSIDFPELITKGCLWYRLLALCLKKNWTKIKFRRFAASEAVSQYHRVGRVYEGQRHARQRQLNRFERLKFRVLSVLKNRTPCVSSSPVPGASSPPPSPADPCSCAGGHCWRCCRGPRSFSDSRSYMLSALAPLTWDYLRLMSTPNHRRHFGALGATASGIKVSSASWNRQRGSIRSGRRPASSGSARGAGRYP
jgi:hypothetical protein